MSKVAFLWKSAFIIMHLFSPAQRHIDPVFEVAACPASGSDVPVRYSNIPKRCQVQCGNDKQRSYPSSDTPGVLSHERDSHILASDGARGRRIHLEKPMLAVTMSTRLASLQALLRGDVQEGKESKQTGRKGEWGQYRHAHTCTHRHMLRLYRCRKKTYYVLCLLKK